MSTARTFGKSATLVALCLLSPFTLGADEGAPRQLILVLDGVPLGAVRSYLDDREAAPGDGLSGFRGPVPLISTFPSTTSVAMTGILSSLGLDTPPGYEARFFDRESGRVRGGGPISYFKIEFPWREFFHWRGPGVWGNAIGALRSIEDSKDRVDEVIEAFLASSEPVFFGHIGSTDRVGHLKAPAALEEVLEHLDRGLAAARREHPDLDFRVTLLSDHGMSGGTPLVNVAKPVRRSLGRQGYRVRKKLKRPRDVALTPYGLVSSFEVYGAEGGELELARSLVTVEGVELCVAVDGAGWRVVGDDGEARIDRQRTGQQAIWTYRPLSGDPIDYERVRVALEDERGSAAGYDSAAWLAATADHYYPDALSRIAGGFELVDNSASVICSVGPGHMFGARKTAAGSRISGQRVLYTHGALDRPSSEGFLMTECPSWRPAAALRFDQGLVEAIECPAPGSSDGRRIAATGE